ncbi:MAG: 1-phosphofructokinase family hexose kinase [Oscillospiraceae bacterium]|nr:1-phosphofructokinase family hexose kinase [Oscillospiraceae bacterium]
MDKIHFIDDFEVGTMRRSAKTVVSPGGKGVNVAKVASALGSGTHAVGFAAGHYGEWLEGSLREWGVGTTFIKVPGEVRTNVNVIDRARGTETEVIESGPEISGSDRLALLAEVERLLSGSDRARTVLICTGGYPLGIPDDFYATLIGLANGLGVRSILDTSGEALRRGVAARPFMVKPNMRELSHMVGYTPGTLRDVAESARSLLGAGPKVVAASMGKDGVLVVSDRYGFAALPPELEAVNTIGSGDAMVAGFAVALGRGYCMRKAIRLATACAASNCMHEEIGLVDRPEVERLSRDVGVDSLQ